MHQVSLWHDAADQAMLFSLSSRHATPRQNHFHSLRLAHSSDESLRGSHACQSQAVILLIFSSGSDENQPVKSAQYGSVTASSASRTGDEAASGSEFTDTVNVVRQHLESRPG